MALGGGSLVAGALQGTLRAWIVPALCELQRITVGVMQMSRISARRMRSEVVSTRVEQVSRYCTA